MSQLKGQSLIESVNQHQLKEIPFLKLEILFKFLLKSMKGIAKEFKSLKV